MLEPRLVLMELKCAGGIPLWMTHTLSDERIYKTSFFQIRNGVSEHSVPRTKKEAVVYA